jgi:hypothetical protein
MTVLQAFAQCRPMAKHVLAGKCVDNNDWQCPLSWMGRLPIPLARVNVCWGHSKEFGACYDSWCCDNAGFGCFKRQGKVCAVGGKRVGVRVATSA